MVSRTGDRHEELVVVLNRNSRQETFGFSVLGGSGSALPVVISEIKVDSLASRCGQLEVGDLLVEANGLTIEGNLTTLEVSRYLQGQPSLTLELRIRKDPEIRRQAKEILGDPTDLDKISKAISPKNFKSLETLTVGSGQIHTLPRNIAKSKGKTLRRTPQSASGFHIHPGAFGESPTKSSDSTENLTKSMPSDVHLIGNCKLYHETETSLEPSSYVTDVISDCKSSDADCVLFPQLNVNKKSPKSRNIDDHWIDIPEDSRAVDEINSSPRSPQTSDSRNCQEPSNGDHSPDDGDRNNCTDEEPSPLQTAHFNSPILGVDHRLTTSPSRSPIGSNSKKQLKFSRKCDIPEAPPVSPIELTAPNVFNGSLPPVTKNLPKNRKDSFENHEDDDDDEMLNSYHLLEQLELSPPNPRPNTEIDLAAAKRLANRLFHLNGFDKADVPRHLGKKQEFSQAVASEYFKFFDFTDESVDVSLRKFLRNIYLCGDTQERERLLSHFAQRYFDCNPCAFPSFESVDYLVTAIVLLNTDLNMMVGGRGGGLKPMTMGQFVSNVITRPPASADSPPEEYTEYSRELLEGLYCSIRDQPLTCASLNGVDGGGGGGGGRRGSQEALHMDWDSEQIDQDCSLENDASYGLPSVSGFLSRKWHCEPDLKKTSKLKRSWREWFCVLQGLNLYHYKSQAEASRSSDSHKHVISIHHALASLEPVAAPPPASGATGRKSGSGAVSADSGGVMFRLRLADWSEYLFKCRNGREEAEEWVNVMNLVAAYSAPPMMPPISNKRTFSKHFRPPDLTRYKLQEQIALWGSWVQQCELLLADVTRRRHNHPSATVSKAAQAEYDTETNYYMFEISRYQTYQEILIENANRCVQVSALPAAAAAAAGGEACQPMNGGGGGGGSRRPFPSTPLPTISATAATKAVDYGVL